MHHEHGARGFSFELEDASPRPPELGRLDFDFSDLAPQGSPDDSVPAGPPNEPVVSSFVRPSVSTGAEAGTPLMPHAAADRRPDSAARPLLTAFATLESSSESAQAVTAPTAAPAPLASPVVRRLSFPTAPAPLKPSPRPSTRFADSIGRSRPLRESFGDAALDEDASPPEDWPHPSANPATEDERPPAPSAEMLRRAGALWTSAKGTALDLGGRGLESSRLLAGQMSEALRERLERKAESERSAAEPARGDLEAPSLAPPAARAPRRLLPRLPQKGTGPLLALVAALGMFIASRHLLGTGGVSLSKTTPAIPELGEVDGEKAEPSGSRSTSAGESAPTAAPAGPPPAMATEVVPLPPGLAWPGKGLLEVVTSEDELVYVDGVFTGRGPLRRVPVTPGEHEVSIRKEGSERHGTAQVELGRTTRALFKRK